MNHAFDAGRIGCFDHIAGADLVGLVELADSQCLHQSGTVNHMGYALHRSRQ
jgi:hypothetical protein